MPKGVLLPRRNSQLPAELTQIRSDVDVMITLASEGIELGSFGCESAVKVTRRLIKQHCGEYRPSSEHENDVLCRSGERDGEPTCGSRCFRCRVSQFSASGMFTGEVAQGTSAVLPELTIEDVVTALEEA